MGIYSRYSAAFLVLALISPQVFSAVRVPVIQNNEYIRQVLSKQTATTGAVTTPAGELAFYGAEKVFSFSAGDSVRPTVREVTPWISGQTASTGSVSYPYGPGSAYPNDPNYSPASATKLKVKPQIVVPKSNILSALKNGIKTNPGQLALTATVAAAVSAVGWVMSPENTSMQIKDGPDTVLGMPYKFLSSQPDGFTCAYATTNGPGFYDFGPGSNQFIVSANGYTQNGFQYVNNCSSSIKISLRGYESPAITESPLRELKDSDLSVLDPWVSQQSAEWLSGLIRDVCNGSLNPGSCYSQMADRSKDMITGPTVLAGPVTSKTTSSTNPDGSVSTKVESTSTNYSFNYGKNYFDVDTQKKTTTTVDGQPVSETTETDDSPIQDVADTPQEEPEPEPEYTFEDSPFPEVEPFYEQKYPDGLQGVWDQAKSDIDNSNFLGFLRSFVPSFSGSCPSFGMSFAIGSMANFGTHEFQSLCYVFDFVKVILMVSAVFLARQLTFGG